MQHTYTIYAQALNVLGVLPRICTLFCRRRVRIQYFHMAEAMLGNTNQEIAHFTIVVRCDSHMAEQLVKQFRRIVELLDVSVSEGDQLPEPSSQICAEQSIKWSPTTGPSMWQRLAPDTPLP